MRKAFLQALAALAAGVLLLATVVAAGRWTRGRLQEQQAYTIPFSAIECGSPEGLAPEDFLGEVQYLAGEHDRLSLLDASLPERLAGAFARHPWVEEVRRVEVLPGRRVRADVVFRRAVLAVRLMHGDVPLDGSVPLPVWAGINRDGMVPCRAVDRHGVLLPVKATTSGLPILNGAVMLPAGRAGTAWGDPHVSAAAASAALLSAHRERLGLGDADWELEGDVLILGRPGLRVVWGRGPGSEAKGEASAPMKVQRLLDYAEAHNGLKGSVHDVRPMEAATHTKLP
jgi:hypothetical protein